MKFNEEFNQIFERAVEAVVATGHDPAMGDIPGHGEEAAAHQLLRDRLVDQLAEAMTRLVVPEL